MPITKSGKKIEKPPHDDAQLTANPDPAPQGEKATIDQVLKQAAEGAAQLTAQVGETSTPVPPALAGLQAAQATASTLVKHPTGAEEVTHEQVGQPKVFQQKPCVVKVGLGATVNLGNYSSARFDVSIEVPCLHPEIDEVFEFGRQWCEERAAVLSQSIQGVKSE
jgi:hypothetical protein